MTVHTRHEAKLLIEKNSTLAKDENMIAITIFHTDIITKEVKVTDIFSHDRFQAIFWKTKYAEDLQRLNVPYIIYIGSIFEDSYLNVEFTEDI